MDSSLKIFSFYILISLLAEIISSIIINLGFSTTLLFNIYAIIEFIFLIVYLFSFKEIKINNSVKFIIILIFLVFQILIISKQDFLEKFDNISWVISNLIIILITLYLMIKLFEKSTLNDYLVGVKMWINFGIITYFTGSLLLFIFLGIIGEMNNSTIFIIWQINILFSFIANILVTIGLWKLHKELI